MGNSRFRTGDVRCPCVAKTSINSFQPLTTRSINGALPEKVRRLISEGKSKADAEGLVDMVDHERAALIKEYFHAEWPNRSIYHAMFNTDTGDEMVVRPILSFLQQSQSTRWAPD